MTLTLTLTLTLALTLTQEHGVRCAAVPVFLTLTLTLTLTQEHGVRCAAVPVFEPSRSPRNVAIVAVKESPPPRSPPSDVSS